MTVQIHQLSALVIGASGGIGAALAGTIAVDPIYKRVARLSRSEDDFDIIDENSVKTAARSFAQAGESFDLIVDATGLLEAGDRPPEKSFAEIDPDAMAAAFAANTIGPALLFKHFTMLLPGNRKSVFVTLSARIGSIGDNHLGGWMSYRASKAALNQIVRCAAIEARRHRPEAVILALHPGTIETGMTKKYARGHFTATADEAAQQMLSVIEKLSPDDTGRFFDAAGTEIVW